MESIQERGKSHVSGLARWQIGLVVLGGLAFAIGISATKPLQPGSFYVVLIAGAALFLVGLRNPRVEPSTQVRMVGVWPWIAVFLAGCAWTVVALLAGNNQQWPTFSLLTDQWTGQPGWRFFAALAWYSFAVWLVYRTTR